MKHIIPNNFNLIAMAATIKNAQPNDVIVVGTAVRLELCQRAAARMNRTDLTIELSEECLDGTREHFLASDNPSDKAAYENDEVMPATGVVHNPFFATDDSLVAIGHELNHSIPDLRPRGILLVDDLHAPLGKMEFVRAIRLSGPTEEL